MLERFFNTTGPCDPERHYMLPPAARLVGAQLHRYIGNQLYWVLHAPRQTGKTTFLQSWMREINAAGEAVSCYVSIERCQGFPNAAEAMPAAVSAIIEFARALLPPELVPTAAATEPASLLSATLAGWAAQIAPKPLVVLFDEVDVLCDQAMVSFLRQLRSGFAMRGIGKFPVSIALVGMRDLRDYIIRAKDGAPVNPGSPFNIKQDSANLSNFSLADVTVLLSQHTSDTGQMFEPESIKSIYELSKGHPWLVNALAQKCVWTLVKQETRAPVKPEHVLQAKEMLIQERAVHLDSLAERLKDPRVKRIVESILVGAIDPELAEGDDFRLCLDLGLVSVENGTPQIANPIYREVIPRVLSQSMQLAIPTPEFKWQRDDGTLDMPALLREFQKFWSRHSDTWEKKFVYTEAFPHLLLMAFLQRITNGGGRIEREYAAGRGRVDLAIEFGGSWSIVEIKLIHPHDGFETILQEGLEQITTYRDRIDPQAEAYLIIFDRRPEADTQPWQTRITTTTYPAPDGKTVFVYTA